MKCFLDISKYISYLIPPQVNGNKQIKRAISLLN